MAEELDLNTEEGTLQELTEAEAKRVRQVYKNAAAQIAKEIKHLPQVPSAALQESYLNGLLKQIESNLGKIDSELTAGITSYMYAASDSYIEKTLDFLQEIGMPVGGALFSVPDDVVRSIASGKVYSGKWSLSTAVWKNHMKVQSDVEKVVAQGVAMNKSVYDIAKDLEKYINPDARKDWDWSKVYPGTNKKVDYGAQRLARTMISHAYQQSFVRATQKNPFVTEYEWQASNSDRMCEICEERDGQHYPKDDLPMDHPNGMCTFIAVMPDSMEDIAERLADWANGAEDPELDKYACDLYGCTMEPSVDPALKEELFTKFGFDPNNPPSLEDWWLQISTQGGSDTVDLIFKEAGLDWDKPNLYDKLSDWYNNTLLSSGTKFVFKENPIAPTTAKDLINNTLVSSAVPPKETWIDIIKGQTEAHMFELEKDSLGKMTSEQISGIKTYTGSSYRAMNGFLRDVARGVPVDTAKSNNLTEDQYSALKAAQAGLSSARLTEPLVLRRGSSIGDLAGLLSGDYEDNKNKLYGLSAKELNDIFAGGVFEYSSFTSTSSIWDKGFSGDLESVFYAPVGAQASSIMSISKYGSSEGETLMNTNTQIRIVSIEESDGHQYSDFRMFAEILVKQK